MTWLQGFLGGVAGGAAVLGFLCLWIAYQWRRHGP